MKPQTNTEILAQIEPPLRSPKRRHSPRADPWWDRRIEYLRSGGLPAYPKEMEYLLALRAAERMKERR